VAAYAEAVPPGRPPKPVAEKVRAGETRPSRLQEVVRVDRRVDAVDAAEPPEHLGDDAAQWWREVAPVLAQAGILERIDRYVLTLTAEVWGEIQIASRVIADPEVGGFFELGSTSQLVAHPALKIRADAQMRFARLITELGLTPLARARLGVAVFTGQAMKLEMEELLGPEGPTPVDAEVIEDGDSGIPGLPGH
jgi:P27 family predicted phage terminase small subunit